MTYAFAAAGMFQLCVLRIFALVVLSAPVTEWNSLIAAFCEAVYEPGMIKRQMSE